MASEVLVPSSPAEAVELFGDGAATTVVGGGTVVVADISYGRLDPSRIWGGRGLQGNSFGRQRVWHIDEDALRRPARRPPPRGGRGGGGNEYLTLLQNVSIPVSEFFGSAVGQWVTVGVATGAAIIAGVVAFS